MQRITSDQGEDEHVRAIVAILAQVPRAKFRRVLARVLIEGEPWGNLPDGFNFWDAIFDQIAPNWPRLPE